MHVKDILNEDNEMKDMVEVTLVVTNTRNIISQMFMFKNYVYNKVKNYLNVIKENDVIQINMECTNIWKNENVYGLTWKTSFIKKM